MGALKTEQLQRIIDESSRIVFFGGAGVSTESGILTSVVQMDCTASSFPIRRNKFYPTTILSGIPKSFIGFTARR